MIVAGFGFILTTSTVVLAQGAPCTPPSGYTAIRTIQNLQDIQFQLNAKFFICDDIQAGGFSFKPIGSLSNPFTGEIEGNGKSIFGISISGASVNNTGIFRVLNGATIRNLGISNAVITAGGDNTGILAGFAESSNLENITVTDSTVSGAGGKKYIGGIVGLVEKLDPQPEEPTLLTGIVISNSTIAGSFNVGGVAGGLRWGELSTSSASELSVTALISAGGLVGELVRSALVYYSTVSESAIQGTLTSGGAVGLMGYSAVLTSTNSLNNSVFTDPSNALNSVSLGGLVGQLYGLSPELAPRVEDSMSNSTVSGTRSVGGLVGFSIRGEISNSFSQGAVNGVAFVGGLVGYVGYSSVNDSYSTTTVESLESPFPQIIPSHVGGLIGALEGAKSGQGEVSNTYSIGQVIGDGLSIVGNSAGGLIGTCTAYTQVSASYFNSDIAGGLLSTCGEARTTFQMTSENYPDTYLGWNFQSEWRENSDDYPTLRIFRD